MTPNIRRWIICHSTEHVAYMLLRPKLFPSRRVSLYLPSPCTVIDVYLIANLVYMQNSLDLKWSPTRWNPVATLVLNACVTHNHLLANCQLYLRLVPNGCDLNESEVLSCAVKYSHRSAFFLVPYMKGKFNERFRKFKQPFSNHSLHS